MSSEGVKGGDDLIAAFHQVFGVPTYEAIRDTSPAAFEDEDTLRRSRDFLAATPTTYRRRADRPTEPWRDEVAVADGDFRESA